MTVLGKGGKTARACRSAVRRSQALQAWLRVRGELRRRRRPRAVRRPAAAAASRARSVQSRLAQLARSARPRRARASARAAPLVRLARAAVAAATCARCRRLLGHASIATTQVYTQLDLQHLAKAYDAAHPRARRKSGVDRAAALRPAAPRPNSSPEIRQGALAAAPASVGVRHRGRARSRASRQPARRSPCAAATARWLAVGRVLARVARSARACWSFVEAERIDDALGCATRVRAGRRAARARLRRRRATRCAWCSARPTACPG
ncbi:MAG: hypothetical protein MZW92_48895 [Comamonadaceae bacterium]|nr:hypothetical protein [Comamonadaceae bacterium]